MRESARRESDILPIMTRRDFIGNALAALSFSALPGGRLFAAYNVCPSKDKAIINAVESNHGGWLKWCRANRSGKKEFDYLDWILGRGEGK